MIVYKITNRINSKIYIGITTQHLYIRISQHKYIAEKTNDNRPLYNSMRKYGFSSFSFEIIDYASNIDELNEKEIKYIKDLNPIDRNIGYNVELGGKLGPVKHLSANDHPMSILTGEEVFEIINLLKTTDIPQKEIALIFNISLSTISAINYGRLWNSINSEEYPIRKDATKKKLNRDIVLNIISDLENTKHTLESIADKYSVSRETIKSICYCKSWNSLHKYKKHIRNGI